MVASPAYGQCPWRLVDAKQADQRVSDALASTRPMRIGLFHSTLPEPGRKPGGVDVFVHRLGNALVERGHDVSMLTFAAKAPADANYRLHRLGRGCIARSRSRPVVAPLTLTARSPSNVDVVHLHGDDWFYVGRRVPTVRTFYGSALCEARSATSTGRRIMQSMLFPLELLASRLATSSFAIADGMPAGYRLMGELPLGFTPPRVALPPKSEAPSVLFVGTWEGRKRGAWLAERFAQEVLPAVPAAQLWMVSDRCEETKNVRWMGRPSDAELSRLFARAWAMCLPSTYEGFGMPYVEAMLHGTPVVATPNVGSNYLLSGGAGLIASDDALGDALTRVLTMPRLRRDLTESGARRADRFLWDNAARAHETAYLAAVDRWRDIKG